MEETDENVAAEQYEGSSDFSEAEEVLVEEDAGEGSDSEEGEDLFGDDMIDDYRPDPTLDQYDSSMLDDTEDHNLTWEERRRAEREMAARDRGAESKQDTTAVSKFYSGFAELLAEEDEEEDDEAIRRWNNRERFREAAQGATRPLPRQADSAMEELPYCDGHAAWSDRLSEILGAIFEGFVWHYRRQSQEAQRSDFGHYVDTIGEMVKAEQTSLQVEWDDLTQYCFKLGDWMTLMPLHTLEVFSSVATKITQALYPRLYTTANVTVRIKGYLSFETLRNLRTEYLNQLVAIEGICIRRTGIFPKLKLVYLECQKCGCDSNGPFEQQDLSGKLSGDLPKRKCQDCQANGPFMVNRQRTVYENFQKIAIQELPASVPAGHVPRQKEIVVLGDLVDTVRPGDDVIVTGIFRTKPDAVLNAKNGFPVFATEILANDVQGRANLKIEEMTEQDIDVIKRLSRNPAIREKLIDSIAPSIWGHRHVKTALAYAMFGGVRRSTASKHTIRGDINVLVLGDPGMGKSQFLKYVQSTFDRTVSTTGKGASAVGLTASVKRDPLSGEWTLEGGALVLADEGICLIDEFDKMNDKDRVSIHEAMEQQSISISKAGIVTSLRARCSVLAAANPIFGRYDNSLSFSENVDLSDPILSRFDIMAVLKDQANPLQDEYLGDFVVESHLRSHPHVDRRMRRTPDEQPAPGSEEEWINGIGQIPQHVLKKYITYARRHCQPELRPSDQTKVADFYGQIRQAATNSGGLPMTIRHLESIMRMATANAKMRLSRFVEKRDLDFAMSTMLESFIQSQKHAVAVNLGRRFGRYRALASSPEEFIEQLLVDILARKGRESLVRANRNISTSMHTQGESTGDFGVDDVHHFDSAEVKFPELTTLAKNLHGIPEAAVQQYVQSEIFKAKFYARREEMEIFIGRSQKDIFSQNLQD